MAPKSFESFQDALDSGCIITEYHKHEENPNYSVHTKRADGTLHAYTNITPDHLKKGLGVQNLLNSWESPYKVQYEGGVAKGGKITDFHKTAKGTWAVHIETTDGLRHSYSSVSEKALEGVSGFSPVEEFCKLSLSIHRSHGLIRQSNRSMTASAHAHITASTKASDSVAVLQTCFNDSFSQITAADNPLKELSAQENLEIYCQWDDTVLIKLRLQDWHRVFENITPRDWDSAKIAQEIKDQSLQMLGKMKSLGVTPDAFIYSCLFKIFSDDWKQVEEFYHFVLGCTKDKLKTSLLLNNRSYQILLEIYNAKHSNYQLKNLLLILWDDIKEIKLKLTRETYLAFLKSKGIEKTGDFISTLHQKLKWRKIVLKERWDLETYAALMTAYSLTGFYDVVDRLYMDMKHERIKVSRECFTAYLRVLEIKQRYSRILVIQNEMELQKDSFENKSVGILLNASLKLGKIDNINYLYQKFENLLKEGNGITWRSYETFLGIYAKLGKLKECHDIYQKYRDLRIKASTEYNQKYNLSRPKVDLKVESAFSRLYMLPEPPRDVLHHMAYAFGYNRDIQGCKNFFKDQVFDLERLTLYHYRKQLGLSRELKLEINKAQTKIDNIRSHKSPKGGSLIRKYKDDISKFNKNLKKNFKNFEVGHEGPVGIVYQGLVEGWKKSLEAVDTDDVGSYYVQMDELVNDLIEMEGLIQK